MKMKKRHFPGSRLACLLILAVGIVISISCKKDSFNKSPDALLTISTDTLSFDTVFTSAGSVTRSFKIFNKNDQKLRLSRVALAGGTSSSFQLNIDGLAGSQADNIEMEGNDSLYVFVQVNVNPNAEEKPFILKDSIEIVYNGNQTFVQLQAYGQNAVFLKNRIITGSETWSRQLPYVILGSVRIDTNAVLKISAGARIYLHADAPFLVDGTLLARGDKDARITFSGDRLEEEYKNLPASWPGIYFRNTSKENVLEYVTIQNGYQGITVQDRSATASPKLTLSKCIINNIYDVGIRGINTEIYADNCLVSNCGNNLILHYGGDYRFTFCTVVSYGNLYIAHKNPVLIATDFIGQEGQYYTAPLRANFTNSIFWGENGIVENEIEIQKKGNGIFEVQFDHVLYKARDEIKDATFISGLKNIPPSFDSINTARNIYDFRFTNSPAAPAVNAGKAAPFLLDLEGKPRDALPDIGCYER